MSRFEGVDASCEYLMLVFVSVMRFLIYSLDVSGTFYLCCFLIFSSSLPPLRGYIGGGSRRPCSTTSYPSTVRWHSSSPAAHAPAGRPSVGHADDEPFIAATSVAVPFVVVRIASVAHAGVAGTTFPFAAVAVTGPVF